MKRAKLVAHLARFGCVLLREGAKHSIYKNLKTGAHASIPRHAALLEYTARGICKHLGYSMAAKAINSCFYGDKHI